MNVAFSTEWFLTIPGILITCGVILLIIALIMFIVGSMKGKKNKEMPNVNEVANNAQPQVEPVQNVDSSISVDNTVNKDSFINNTVDSTPTVAVSEPMGPIEEVNNTTPIIPEVPVIDVPQVQPVVNNEVPSAPTIPAVEVPSAPTIPNVEVPTVDIQTPEVNPVTEVVPTPEVPVINTETITAVNEPVVDVPNVSNLDTTNTSNIYGGVVPTVEPIPTQEIPEARPIYGGADPLEATQNLPKVDVHHEPYSGGQTVEVVPPVIPTPVEVTPIPEVAVPEVASEEQKMPVVNEQQVAEVTPNVVQIPDVEQL